MDAGLNPLNNDAPLRVGDVLYGFCGGYFGRESYADKRIEAIGADWIVCRDFGGYVHMTTIEPEKMDELKEYRIKPEEED